MTQHKWIGDRFIVEGALTLMSDQLERECAWNCMMYANANASANASANANAITP